MSVEIKPGWWRMRNGEIAYVTAIRTDSVAYQVVGWTKSDVEQWTIYGAYFQGETDERDLIEYLPDCTGFDWVPQTNYVPFDRETVPRDAWYKSKSTGAEHRIVRISDDCVFFTGNGSYMWHELLRDFTIDGNPAGRAQ